MKIATNFMFTKISAKEGIKKFGEKEAVVMVKKYKQIYKGTMAGNPVVTSIDLYKL